ncbi:4-alpha-glucanotransferase, partial [filamentous cyanobacterium CCP5]
MTSFPRASGILLHPTSLPGRYGIGNLGPEAYRFVDFLAETGQQLWQVLPLGPTGHGNSPYLCYSSMAGNPLLISLEQLCDRGLLTYEEIQPLAEISSDRVDYDQVAALKLPLLETAAERFIQSASEQDRADFKEFSESCDFWLDGYSFYMALKKAHGGSSWTDWEPAIARREPEA